MVNNLVRSWWTTMLFLFVVTAPLVARESDAGPPPPTHFSISEHRIDKVRIVDGIPILTPIFILPPQTRGSAWSIGLDEFVEPVRSTDPFAITLHYSKSGQSAVLFMDRNTHRCWLGSFRFGAVKPSPQWTWGKTEYVLEKLRWSTTRSGRAMLTANLYDAWRQSTSVEDHNRSKIPVTVSQADGWRQLRPVLGPRERSLREIINLQPTVWPAMVRLGQLKSFSRHERQRFIRENRLVAPIGTRRLQRIVAGLLAQVTLDQVSISRIDRDTVQFCFPGIEERTGIEVNFILDYLTEIRSFSMLDYCDD